MAGFEEDFIKAVREGGELRRLRPRNHARIYVMLAFKNGRDRRPLLIASYSDPRSPVLRSTTFCHPPTCFSGL
jgi:hypothetical protein